MMDRTEIEFHYERAIQQAARLQAVSARLRRAASEEMGDLLDEIYRIWKSGSTESYLRKGEQAEEDIRVTAEELDRIAKEIRTVAERVRATELEARRIANEHR